jgi:hypothetical protein
MTIDLDAIKARMGSLFRANLQVVYTTDVNDLVAEVEKMRALLAEARLDLEVYVDADYPENIRAQYPDMERKYQRDMDLCYRIDAALKGTDDDD